MRPARRQEDSYSAAGMPLSLQQLVFGRFERKPDAKAGAIRPGAEIDFSAMAFDNDSVADDSVRGRFPSDPSW